MLRALMLTALLSLSGLAAANEAAVKKLTQAKFPDAKIESVVKTAYGGLYEVYMDGRIHYTDEKMTFFIIGQLIDTKTSVNVTEQRFRKFTALNLKDLPPPEMAITRVKGDGRRQLIVFSDPMCPYCRRIEQELNKLNNVTIYLFPYPLEKRFPGSTELAKAIWCAPDRAKAWDEWMLKGQRPAAKGTCVNPIDDLERIGGKLNIEVTPTVIFADGAPMNGMVSAADLNRLLNQTPGPASKP
jgi:thiol:disulfide interchange protein DsbC